MKERFEATLLVKHTKWPTGFEKAPFFAEIETSTDTVQTFCDCGPVDDALACATHAALVLELTESVTNMTVEAAKDRVRMAIAKCWLVTLTQVEPDNLRRTN